MKTLKKRGMFFTLMVIVFLFVFVFYFKTYSYQKYAPRMNVIEHRVNTINDFIKDLQRDIERGFYISSYRSLIALNDYINASGDFLDDVSVSFREVLINGTVNEIPMEVMENSTFTDWVNNIKLQASKLNIGIDITTESIAISQNSPWTIVASLDAELYVNDSSGIASWDTSYDVETVIDISGFKDPLYAVNTNKKVANVISQTVYEDNYTIGNDVSNLLDHLDNSYYATHTDAPSYLMRFENNINPSVYGIESLVNLEELTEQGIPIEERSAVDYIYWSDSVINNSRINDTPDWFYLDEGHLEKYNVTLLSYQE